MLAINKGRVHKKSHTNKGKGKADKGKQVMAYQSNSKANNQPKKNKVNPTEKKD